MCSVTLLAVLVVLVLILDHFDTVKANDKNNINMTIRITHGCCPENEYLIKPNEYELDINEGDSLEINCTSDEIFYFNFPRNFILRNETFPLTSQINSNQDNIFKINLKKKNLSIEDTGYYVCRRNGTLLMKESYWNSSSIYVYVNSNSSLFVSNETIHIFGKVGDSIILPCRPTSSNLNVTIRCSFTELPYQYFDRMIYNSKIGYCIENLSKSTNGTCYCEVVKNNLRETREISIMTITRNFLKEPMIIINPKVIMENQDLNMACLFEVNAKETKLKPFVFWFISNNVSRRIKSATFITSTNYDTYLWSNELFIKNITINEQANYTCNIKFANNTKSTSTTINIFEPNYKYINLTLKDGNNSFKILAKESVIFTASVFRAFQPPLFFWFSPNGSIIKPDDKFVIINELWKSTLEIKNVKFNDAGTYMVQASRDEIKDHLNFTLEVIEKPSVFLDSSKIKSFYILNGESNFHCLLRDDLQSNVTMIYKKCLNLNIKKICETIRMQEIQKEESSDETNYEFKTIIDKSGEINCTACNNYGCYSAIQNIFVSDLDYGEANGIKILPKEEIVEGDNVTVICGATVYNYSSVVWFLNDTELNNNHDRFKITFNDTEFSHRTLLTITNVTKTDNHNFECKITSFDGKLIKLFKKLNIKESEKCEFTMVNLNDSMPVVWDKEYHKHIHLKCYVKGLPKPVVTWYKNDVPLKFDEEQYELQSEGQELIIMYFLENDSGTYTCVAENPYGKVKRSQSFKIQSETKGATIPMTWMISLLLLILILIGLLIYCSIKNKKEKTLRKQLLEDGLMHFEEGALDCSNPDLMVDDQAEILPYDKKWEFPRERLKLGKRLGSGAFGVVMKAEAYGIKFGELSTIVAVKMVRRNAEPAFVRALASELKIMVHLGQHLNVVNLLGASTNNIAKRELLVIVEYCRFGNLQNYLLRHRDTFVDQIDPSTGKIDLTIVNNRFTRSTNVGNNESLTLNQNSDNRILNETSLAQADTKESIIYHSESKQVADLTDVNIESQPGWRSNYQGDYKNKHYDYICTQDLLSWAFQVARGMEYLCQRKVMHGDLAARNILLAENKVVKICDFGLAKTMYKSDSYKKQHDVLLPIKWLAIESISDRVFSTQSDVWSFGIVLWEFFTLAKTPYAGIQTDQIFFKLVEGYRMEQPKYATKDIYDVMTHCWNSKPNLRPSFTELVDSIGEILEDSVKMHYVDLNIPYMDMNKASLEGKKDYLAMMSAPDNYLFPKLEHNHVNDLPFISNSDCLNNDSNDITFAETDKITKYSEEFTQPTITNTIVGKDEPMLKKIQNSKPEEHVDELLISIKLNNERKEFVKQNEIDEIEKRQELKSQ